MKQNWRIFEKVLSGVQIILGFLLLYVIATTITEYYTFLWKNPLFDHKSIIEISFKKTISFSFSPLYLFLLDVN